jgi:hypothetical protein
MIAWLAPTERINGMNSVLRRMVFPHCSLVTTGFGEAKPRGRSDRWRGRRACSSWGIRGGRGPGRWRLPGIRPMERTWTLHQGRSTPYIGPKRRRCRHQASLPGRCEWGRADALFHLAAARAAGHARLRQRLASRMAVSAWPGSRRGRRAGRRYPTASRSSGRKAMGTAVCPCRGR